MSEGIECVIWHLSNQELQSKGDQGDTLISLWVRNAEGYTKDTISCGGCY